MPRKLFIACLAILLYANAPALGADGERTRPPIPEEMSEAWERFQRSLHEWGGRLWERLGPRGAREDRPVISLILTNKETLNLSADQTRRIETLRDNFQRLTIRNDADLRIIELDIAGMLESEPVEIAKLEAKMREEEKLRADIRIARIRAIEQAKALLSADQKKKLTELLRQSPSPRAPFSSQNPAATERGQPSR